MKNQHTGIPLAAGRTTTYRMLLRSLLAMAIAGAFFAQSACAESYERDQEIDKSLGLLGRPWKMNLVRLRTRDHLRLRARVKTGLPAYDQQVERALESPASLLEQPTTPDPDPTPTVEPDPEPTDSDPGSWEPGPGSGAGTALPVWTEPPDEGANKAHGHVGVFKRTAEQKGTRL